MEAQVRDYGFSPAQQDEICKRCCEGQSFSLIGRALGAPMQNARRFLHQSGGIRETLADCHRRLVDDGLCHRRWSAQVKDAVAGLFR
ncbi:hypothetical protein [Streptomyces sp. NPDC006739]|uniref:hypothetical protein n=1 Tax=Streptomyces sp. NPDC006739 TaxID=3364763 RepID=UPI00369209A2